MRRIWLLFLLLACSLSVAAQETYTVNEHGTYVIDSGVITKVPFRLPTDGNIGVCGFWRNYAVFCYSAGGSLGILVFNIENGASNDIFDESFSSIPEIIKDDTHLCIMIGKWNNDYYPHRRWWAMDNFDLDYYIYKFDMKSLELLEETFVGRLLNRQIYYPTGEKITYNIINDNTVRYAHGDKTFDIVYGQRVDMRQWDRFYVYYDSRLNRYAVFVSEFYDGK